MKTLDRSRDFATVSGQAEHRYEQDGKRFDAEGACMDEAGYKKPGAPPARDTRTTAAADPTIIEQIGKQTTDIVVGKQTAETGTSTDLATLALPKKIDTALRAAEIDTVEALSRCTGEQLVAMPGIGDAAVTTIKKALKKVKKALAG